MYKLTIIGDNTISDDKLYIDKDTWLLIKKESENLTQFFEYKMNVVTEKDVEMPKMHKYIICFSSVCRCRNHRYHKYGG